MSASHEFPAAAAKSLIEGYCQDFVSLAAPLAQTIEQMRVRRIPFESCREALERCERGMREMADAIREALQLARMGATATAPPTAPRVAAAPTAAPTVVPSAAPPASPSAAVQAMPLAEKPPPAMAAPKPAAAASPGGGDKPAPVATGTAPVAVRQDGRQDGRQDPQAGDDTGLCGTSETMPLLSVFQFLNRTRKSGTLHVEADGEVMTFEFVAGVIEFTTSSRMLPGERLGDILTAMFPGLRDNLEGFLRVHEKQLGVRRLGAVLVRQGVASNGQVMEALERQVLLRFRRVTKARLARYRFEEGERVQGDGRIRIRPFELAPESRAGRS